MRRKRHIKVWLSAEALREFETAAQWHDKPPVELAALLIHHFMTDSRKHSPPIGLPADISVIAIRRQAILLGWMKAMKRAPSSRRVAAGQAYLRRVRMERGDRVSLSTMYGWKRRYERWGRAGLIDGRRWKGKARLASSSRWQSAARVKNGPSIGV